jgi:hypothetical protein
MLFTLLLLLAALTAWFLIPALSIFQRLVGEPAKRGGDISRPAYDCLGRRIRRLTSHKPRTITIITTGTCLLNTIPTAPAISRHFRVG